MRAWYGDGVGGGWGWIVILIRKLFCMYVTSEFCWGFWDRGWEEWF